MKRRILTVALVLAVVAGGVTVVVWNRHDDTLARPSSTPAQSPAPRCGLPGTPGPAVTGATAVRWDTVTGWPLPISQTDGPADRESRGPWSCFARTPSGAVLAGYVISIRAGGVAVNWQQVVREQTVPGAGQDTLLKHGLSATSPVTPRGFDLAAYSEERATIRYYLSTGEGDASCTIDVVWYADDWRVKLQDDGSSATGCTLDVPVSFTPWGP